MQLPDTISCYKVNPENNYCNLQSSDRYFWKFSRHKGCLMSHQFIAAHRLRPLLYRVMLANLVYKTVY